MTDCYPVIVAARRTPVGRFLGSFTKTAPTKLGSYVLDAIFEQNPVLKDHIDECIMGCVLQAGLGQNPARQVGLGAGLPTTLSAKTINKVCGSGLEAIMMAAQSIKAGDNCCVIAGGIESMSGSPHYAYVRSGVKFGDTALTDHMQHDGLTCPFEHCGMGNSADYTAKKNNISREDQDAFSVQSHTRAAHATKEGWFKDEIVALTGAQLGNRRKPGPEGGLDYDEGVRADSTIEGLAKLRPAFTKDGTVTAGNASQISDGAAAVCVMCSKKADEMGIKPIARVLSYATSGVDPKDIFEAPILGVKMACEKAGLSVEDIDLFELNEAFAAQALCNIRALEIPQDKVNVAGGAIAIGHPLGASGARIFVTLLHQMQRTGAKRGLAGLCLGGGNSVAIIVEMV